MREKIRSAYHWTKAAFFTLLIHAAIIYVLIFGLFNNSKEIEAGGKPIQATVVNQSVLDEKKEEKVRQLADLEAKRREEEAQKLKIEEEKKAQLEKAEQEKERIEQEQKKQEQELLEQEKRKQAEEEKKKLEADKQRKKEEDKKRKLEEEKKKKAEEEKRRKVEEEKKRKEEQRKKEAERKKAEEKKKREEAERRRKDEERRQAEEKLQREIEARQRELEIQVEAEAIGALNASEGRIKRAIENNWRPPSGVISGLKVLLRLKVSPNGDVLSVKIVRSSGDPYFDQSAEVAVKKASPLPTPANPLYYQHIKEFEIEFSPDE